MRVFRMAVPSLVLMAACSNVRQELSVVFPTESARGYSKTLTYLAIEPLLPGQDAPRFVGCGEIGVFPPTRVIDPDSISTFPGLKVLRERQGIDYPLESDWDISFDAPTVDAKDNPWGVAMVYLEARGEVRAPQDQGGGMVTATLLAGCYCIRTAEGTHANAALDNEVKKACELVVDGKKLVDESPRVVELKPVPRVEFRLEPCGGEQLAAPRNQLLSPGPTVCIRTIRCQDATVANCFDCGDNCADEGVFRNAPIAFTVDQPGGASTPGEQVVLTDSKGVARGAITVDDCSSPIAVKAQVVGRSDPPISFAISCVNPASTFECQGDLPSPLGAEPKGIAVLPGDVGRPDSVAVLVVSSGTTLVQVIDLANGNVEEELRFESEEARAIVGYYYEPSSGDRSGQRPVLAVATSDPGNALRLRLYDWDYSTRSLSPHDGASGLIAETCLNWACGTQDSCAGAALGGSPCQADETCQNGLCTNTTTNQASQVGCCDVDEVCMCGRERCDVGGQGYCSLKNPVTSGNCGAPMPPAFVPPAVCGCQLKVEFGTDISFSVADLDHDGKNDLGVATSSDLPVVVYYSAQAQGGNLYEPQGCKCGRFAQAPSAFELLNFGGTVDTFPEAPLPGSADLVIGAPGGAFVKYASRRPNGNVDLSCGQPRRFGDLVPVRDVRRGRFQCNPFSNQSCDAYEDVVIVAAKSLGGGSFDDPGTIRIVYGASKDLSQEGFAEDPTSSQELIPKAFPTRTEPKDPRTAQIADFNDDGNDDLAILFGGGSQPEVHIWLGAANRGVGEVNVGVMVDQCAAAGNGKDVGKCNAFRRFATPDIDGDGRAEVVVICDANASNARLRWFAGR